MFLVYLPRLVFTSLLRGIPRGSGISVKVAMGSFFCFLGVGWVGMGCGVVLNAPFSG